MSGSGRLRSLMMVNSRTRVQRQWTRGIWRYARLASCLIRRRPLASEDSCHPIGHVVHREGVVVRRAMLGATLGKRKHFEFAYRAIDRFLIGSLGVLQRDLPVVFAMHDKDRASNFVHDALEGKPARDLTHLFGTLFAKHPLG